MSANVEVPPGLNTILREALIEAIGDVAEDLSGAKATYKVGVITQGDFEKARKCGEELGKKGDIRWEEGEYQQVQGNCDPLEYLPGGGSVEEAE